MISSHDTTDPDYSVANTVFEDSIANMSWHHNMFIFRLAVSSWDSKIRHFRVGDSSSLSIQETAAFDTQFPCLALDWMGRSNCLVTGSMDGTVASLDLERGGVMTTFGKHHDVVKGVYYCQELELVCSVSYDQSLQIWDPRQQNAVGIFNLGAKPVCSDMAYPFLAVGLNNQKLFVFDIKYALATQSLGPEMDTNLLGPDSPLSSVSLSKEGDVIGLGSYSGRSVVSWLKPSDEHPGSFTMNNTYCFKGHKVEPGQPGNISDKPILFPINTVAIHPQSKDTYLTGGSDGFINFWDVTKKSRLGGFTWKGVPVTEAKWSRNGIYVAYGIGYDWSKGIEGAKSHQTKLCIHKVQPNELSGPTSLFV